ncbi:MAG: adenylate/guanylate cyclase domain-containing protein [Alphaproteobacteria bacterium]|nr:adenylate/guanylate cyclase domain-containing protein [Alphaproteobacteria bacterium]
MADEKPQRRLAAILAADVAGYSRLMGEDEGGTLALLKALRGEILDPKLDEHGGRIVNTAGDGLLIEFPSAVGALEYAIGAQQALAKRNEALPENRRIRFRMGINLGDVIVDGEEIYGDGVNIAARLEALAEPGRICISAMVRASVRGKLDVDFEDLGDQSLKNIAEPVHAYAISPAYRGLGPEGTGTASALLHRPAVAVLPFENLSADPEQEYFADGLTEDIITALSSWRFFPVIARNSTFAYKGQAPDVRQVGEELGARYVIEGSVRKAGNRVRVTAQLINAETGHHVWAARYDRDLEGIFELQDEITTEIAAVIAPELVKAESERSASKRSENLDAWDYCQRGKFMMNDLSSSGLSGAKELFEKALERDPDLVDAWCGIAHTCQRELVAGSPADFEAAKKLFLDAAQRAVALDRARADAHYNLCFAYLWNGRLAEAVEEAELAVDLNPIDPNCHDRLGAALIIAGRPEEGVASIEKGFNLGRSNPRASLYRANLARAYLDTHRHGDAADQARQNVQAGRTYLDEGLILASALGHLGRAEEARAVLDDLEGYRGIRISDITLCPWWRLYQDPGPNEHLLDGLRKAGVPD